MRGKQVTQIKKRVQIGLYLLLICLVVAAVPMYGDITARVGKITASDVILIDPGHGGMDGGAQSADGTPEKDINLAISKEIQKLAEADGWRVVMTREEDKGLYTDESRAIRSMKTEDLRARKTIIDKTEATLAVSIHLNSFKEDRSVRGAQVFYPSGGKDTAVIDESKNLAELIQEQIKTGINDGTDRVALSKKNVLILKEPLTPIVIVECGFLSNHAETELLKSAEYQRKLAKCIYSGIMQFTGKDAKKSMAIIDSRGNANGFK